MSLNGEDFQQIEKKMMLPDMLEAPVKVGEVAGVLRYELSGKVLGEVEILVDGDVKKAGYGDYLRRLWKEWLMERTTTGENDESSQITETENAAEVMTETSSILKSILDEVWRFEGRRMQRHRPEKVS